MKLMNYTRITGIAQTIVVATLLFGSIHTAMAQRSASANVSVEIIQGIRVVKNTNLRFGAMIPGGTGGTVTVSITSSRTATGSIILLTSSSFPYTAATFTLLGAPSLNYSIVLPSSVTLTRQGGSETVSVATFVSNPSSNGTLDSGGNGTLAVGATLTVPANQTPGYYTGPFNVTLNYP